MSLHLLLHEIIMLIIVHLFATDLYAELNYLSLFKRILKLTSPY